MKLKNLLVIFSLLLFQSYSSKVFAVNVAFYTGTCVDFTPGNCFSEANNLLNFLNAQGHTVTTFSSNVPSLTGIDVLYYSEFERCNLQLSAAEITAINDFVSSGGNLIVHGGTNSSHVSLINTVFALNVVADNFVFSGQTSLNTPQVAGTSFEGCAPIITSHSATALIVNSMPADKTCIYQNSAGTSTSVATIPVGLGQIGFIGWDFFEGGPGCANVDSDWNAIVDKMLAFTSEEEIVPTMSQWGLMIFGLLILNMGLIFVGRIELA